MEGHGLQLLLAQHALRHQRRDGVADIDLGAFWHSRPRAERLNGSAGMGKPRCVVGDSGGPGVPWQRALLTSKTTDATPTIHGLRWFGAICQGLLGAWSTPGTPGMYSLHWPSLSHTACTRAFKVAALQQLDTRAKLQNSAGGWKTFANDEQTSWAGGPRLKWRCSSVLPAMAKRSAMRPQGGPHRKGAGQLTDKDLRYLADNIRQNQAAFDEWARQHDSKTRKAKEKSPTR